MYVTRDEMVDILNKIVDAINTKDTQNLQLEVKRVGGEICIKCGRDFTEYYDDYCGVKDCPNPDK